MLIKDAKKIFRSCKQDADSLFNAAFKIVHSSQNNLLECYVLYQLGDVNIKSFQFDSALNYFNKAELLIDTAKHFYHAALLYQGYGLYYKKTNNYYKAIGFQEKSLLENKKIINSNGIQSNLTE